MRPSSRHATAMCTGIASLGLAACSLLVDTSGLANGTDAKDGASPDAVGLIDGSTNDALVSTEAGSDAGIASAYATEVLQDLPIAYFHLDEPAGSTTIKSVVGSFMGAFTKGVTLGSPSSVVRLGNTAATFTSKNGSEDSDLSLGANFVFTGSAPFTVEAWIDPTSPDGFARHVLSRADRSSGDEPENGWNLCVSNNPSFVIWIERDGGDFSNFHRSTEVAITPAVFSHVVAGYDGARLFIYVNGDGAAPVTQTGDIVSGPTSAYLGSANGGVNPGHGFIGVIDELAIYDKVLPASRVSAHYAAGKL